MVAYDIDTAAVMAAARDAATELAPLAAVTTGLQDQVASVEAVLGSSRVARAFASYANDSLLHDLRSALSRADEAVQGVRQATAEYLRGDEQMRARSEAAAAAVPDASGRRTESAIPPAALPIVPPAPPVPPASSASPVPLPKSGGPDSGPARALPGRPPIVVARDLMLRLHYPCPGSWLPPPDCFGPRWPGPAYPPGARFPWRPGPAYPPGGWSPRWPEPGLPPRGRFPWWPARPLPGLFPDPRITPSPGHVHAWPLEIKRLPTAVALGGPEPLPRQDSSGKWGLT